MSFKFQYIIVLLLLVFIIVSVFTLLFDTKKENSLFFVTDINNFSGITKKDFQIVEISGLKPNSNELLLNGTIYSGFDCICCSYAVITNKRKEQDLYCVGDPVGSFIVDKIFKGSIILRGDGFKTTLKLKFHNKLLYLYIN